MGCRGWAPLPLVCAGKAVAVASRPCIASFWRPRLPWSCQVICGAGHRIHSCCLVYVLIEGTCMWHLLECR